MVEWERVRTDLEDAGYGGFTHDTGETAVPELSGTWVVGWVPRTGPLARENLPLVYRLLDALALGAALPTDPEYAPREVRDVAADHGLEVVIVSCDADRARIALCDPNDA